VVLGSLEPSYWSRNKQPIEIEAQILLTNHPIGMLQNRIDSRFICTRENFYSPSVGLGYEADVAVC